MSTSTAIVPFVRRPRFVPEVGDGLGDRDGALNASGDSYCGSSWDVDGEPPRPPIALCALSRYTPHPVIPTWVVMQGGVCICVWGLSHALEALGGRLIGRHALACVGAQSQP